MTFDTPEVAQQRALFEDHAYMQYLMQDTASRAKHKEKEFLPTMTQALFTARNEAGPEVGTYRLAGLDAAWWGWQAAMQERDAELKRVETAWRGECERVCEGGLAALEFVRSIADKNGDPREHGAWLVLRGRESP